MPDNYDGGSGVPPSPEPPVVTAWTREKSPAPTVWMRTIRPHTYHRRTQDEGDIYLAHEDEVENIEILKFAVRDTPPPRAKR